MLSHISWQQYLAATGIAAIAYYLIITWLFYRKQLFRLLTGKGTATPFQPTNATNPPNLMGAVQEETEVVLDSGQNIEEETISGSDLEFSPDNYPDDDYDDQAAASDTFDELEQLSVRLRSLMENSGKKANRTELTQRIKKELAAFSAKTNPENFKEAINRFVREQCKVLCNVQIEPADLKVIWS